MDKNEAMQLAERAVWAILQSDIVGLDMVDNLDEYVAQAVRIAAETNTVSEAIEAGSAANDK